MKKFLKALQLTSIAVAASAVVLVVVYFFETNTVAGRTKDNEVVATIELTESVDETTVAATETAAETVTAVEENVTVESTAAEKVTVKEDVKETVEETTAVTVKETVAQTVEKTTQQETEKATEAVKETEPVAVKKTETVKETVAAPVQTTVLTDIVYKDGAGNTHSYNTIDEAKASIKVATLSDADAKAAAKANKAAYKAQAEEVIELINTYRMANGLVALSYNDTIATAAMHRAAESAYADWNMTAKENGAKRHIRPNYEVASTIADEYGITGNFGENFGRWQATPDEIVSGWQNSDSHNKLLLGSNYTQIGVGVAVDLLGDFYWVAIFN